MFAFKNPATSKAKLRVEDLENRLVMTAYNFDPGITYANTLDAPRDQILGDDSAEVEWNDIFALAAIQNELEFEFTLNSSGAQSFTVAADDDAPSIESFDMTVTHPKTNIPTNATPVFVRAESNTDGDHGDSKDLRPNRRTVKDVLTTRADVVVAVSIAAHMK